MRVALGRGQACVSKELLDDPKVGPAAQEVGGEAVPEGVGADLSLKGHLLHARAHQLSNTTICQSTTVSVNEQGIGGRSEPLTYG